MADKVENKLNMVRNCLANAGKNLSPADWKELLEELGADIEGHLDAIREEAEEL